jgi:hypothetical protein
VSVEEAADAAFLVCRLLLDAAPVLSSPPWIADDFAFAWISNYAKIYCFGIFVTSCEPASRLPCVCQSRMVPAGLTV